MSDKAQYYMIGGFLGAGKTTFVRGACRALGVTAPVTSPTYTIGHRYEGEPDVSHLDLYRFTAVTPAEWGDLYRAKTLIEADIPLAAGSDSPYALVDPWLGMRAACATFHPSRSKIAVE